MSNYHISSKNYIIIDDYKVLNKEINDSITINESTIHINNKEPMELQIIFLVHNDLTYNIQIHKFSEVNLIITKIIENEAHLQLNMNIEDGAIVSAFSENGCTNPQKVTSTDEVHLQSNASIQLGYAELSDGSYEAKYHYYLDGEGAEAKVRMAILSKENEDKHYEILIHHNNPHTSGQMDNYGVVKDSARLVIDGIGTITKGQYGSSSHQTNKIMVFDPACKASANPYLYIDEYDVKASHAAGVGKMDEEHLYYLQSRGLSKKQAMQLITYGYLKPVMQVIDNPMIKERFEEALSKVGEDHD